MLCVLINRQPRSQAAVTRNIVEEGFGYPCSQATPRFYLTAVEKIPEFSLQLQDKSGSDLGTRLGLGDREQD